MIPKIIHHVWVTENRFKYSDFRVSWMKFHPEYTFHFWNLNNIYEYVSDDAKRVLSNSRAFWMLKAEVMKYECIRVFGGLYVDTDFECLKVFDDLLAKNDSFVGEESPDGNIGTALLAGGKGNDVFVRASNLVCSAVIDNLDLCNGSPTHTVGPQSRRLQKILRRCETVYPYSLFYPFNCMEPHKRDEHFPCAMAKHHWTCKDKDGWMGEHGKFLNGK